MELKIFFALSITLSLQAYDLREIVNSLHTSEKAKEIKEKSYADIASAALNTAYESPEFGVGLTEVRLDDGSDKGLEYSMGVSQNIAQPFSHKSKKRAALAMTNSIKQEAKHTFHIFVLDTVSLYHDVCIAKELKEEAKVLYEDQVKMFGQVQSSYDLGEVSKKSLLLNKLELMKLEQKTSAYKRAYEIDLHSLQSQVDSLEIKEVSCDDMFEIKRDIELSALEEHGEVKRINFEKDASASYLNVYDAMLQSIAYEVSYERELDAKRYGLGVSIPLSSFTDSSEIAKKEYLHKNAALNFEKETLMQEVKSTSASLQVKLQTLYDEYTLVENEILPLNRELLRLSKSAYLEGEGSAMEFLYTSRSYSEISVRQDLDKFGRIEPKEVSVVDKFKKMFTEGKVTGQMRSIYAGYKQEETGAVDTYATAIGGILKYELASLNGFNAGAAFIISHDIDFATGNGAKQDPELSSDKGNYSELSEAYINYKNGGFNLRVGRQLFDTPLADSDDVRMVPNTFEAYLATYKVSHFTFTAGNVQRWQGAGAGLGYDNGVSLESEWIDIGGQGTFFGGVTYQDDWEVNVWYYDIPHLINATKATYIDINSHTYNGALAVHGSLQYLHESESKNSGVDAEIFGALFEIEMHGLGFNLAYNASKKHKGKKSFSGIGGGSMFTSMDTMIIDEITEDREAQAIVGGLVYAVDNWNFIYAYGDFDGKENSAGVKAHIVEQNIGFEYSVNDEFVLAAIFVSQEDKENGAKTANDWDRTQIMLKYDF